MSSEEICSICLEIVRNGPTSDITRQNCCNRLFHKECLDNWYNVRPTCPLCRTRKDDWSSEEINLYNIFVYVRRKYIELDIDSTLIKFSEFFNYVLQQMETTNGLPVEFESIQKNLKLFDNIIKFVRLVMGNESV